MYKIRLFIWKTFWPPDKVRLKEQHWISKKIERLIKGGTGGGTLAMTFWETVKFWGLLLLLVGGSVALYIAFIFAAAQH